MSAIEHNIPIHLLSRSITEYWGLSNNRSTRGMSARVLGPGVLVLADFLWPDRPNYFPGDASDKEPTCQLRRHKRGGFDPWVGRIPGGRNGNPLQCSCLGKVFLPGKSHGQRSLAGYSPWGCRQLDTTEWLSMHAWWAKLFPLVILLSIFWWPGQWAMAGSSNILTESNKSWISSVYFFPSWCS